MKTIALGQHAHEVCLGKAFTLHCICVQYKPEARLSCHNGGQGALHNLRCVRLAYESTCFLADWSFHALKISPKKPPTEEIYGLG